jgi:hypothetical protein
VVVKKKTKVPPPMLLRAGTPLLRGLILVGLALVEVTVLVVVVVVLAAVVWFPKTPVGICNRSGRQSGGFFFLCWYGV